tara:strand:+ start:430 stop:738 length:309 start_codon:yes stop_codon:yes gene_type:complete
VAKKKRNIKKTDTLPAIPFHYDFYMVYWEDIQSDSGWRTLKEIQKSKPAICVSTGWLVKQDKNVHVLMSDYNYDEHMELSDGGNTTVIPTKNVIEKFIIKGL